MAVDWWFDDTRVVRDGESVQNWMCGSCSSPIAWFESRTKCCNVRAVGAYSRLRCPLCLDDNAGWNLYDDGTTRPCACSVGCIGRLPAQPNPDMRVGLSAYVLSLVAKTFAPECFPAIVPRRPASLTRSESR